MIVIQRGAAIAESLRVLLLEDNPADAELITRELQRAGFLPTCKRVETRMGFVQELGVFSPDVILSDFSLPTVDGLEALGVAHESAPGIPFIFVSGTVGEEITADALRNGASDYVHKDRLGRLGISIRRAMREAKEKLERKATEERLLRSEEMFRLISENAVDLIAVLDPRGKRLYSSPSYRNILGTPDELFGTDSFREIHPEDRERMRAIFHETLMTGKGQRAEYRLLGKNGTLQYIESHGSAIRDKNGKVSRIVVVSRDITERKAAEHDREILEEQLRQAQKMESIGALAGGIAHDFNNILGIILGYTALVQGNGMSPEKLADSLSAIVKATDRGSGLVKQLMTFARKSAVSIKQVDVNSVIEELEMLLSSTFPKTIEFVTDLSFDLPTIKADASQLHQALLNLCVNARDAMPAGGLLKISTMVVQREMVKHQSSSAQQKEFVLVEIADTGIGIHEEIRRRIFEPFFTTKEQGKGTGLGLAVVYGVVKSHFGFIEVDSAPGRGTTFRIFLPVNLKEETAVQEKRSSILPPRGGTETILLVEDEELLVDLLTALLSSYGYQSLIARTGREAIEVFRIHHKEIALVLSDLGLPELGGRDAFLRMREIEPGLKVIFATGFIEEDERNDLLKMGAHSIILKPYVPNEILQIVRSAIDNPVGA
jgi:PAS domain S-box-containing protein